uniref:Uncharacterized protein n=1 Tax=Gossypium raimondii TaxID=29730 RepID=A0A0D2PRG7_GOSRA|nr:hypothetical protein B456_008G089000 [Gossypium raimondii]
MSKIEHNDVKMKSEGAVRARSKKALLVKSEDDDVKALRYNPQVSRIQTEERTKESAKLLSKREVPEPQARSLLALDKDFQQISETTKQGLVIQHIKEFKHLPGVHAHRGTSTK